MTRFVQTVSRTRQTFSTQTDKEQDEQKTVKTAKKNAETQTVEESLQVTAVLGDLDLMETEEAAEHISVPPPMPPAEKDPAGKPSFPKKRMPVSPPRIAPAPPKRRVTKKEKPEVVLIDVKPRISFFGKMKKQRPRRDPLVRFDMKFLAFCTSDLPNKAASAAKEAAAFLPVALADENDRVDNDPCELETWKRRSTDRETVCKKDRIESAGDKRKRRLSGKKKKVIVEDTTESSEAEVVPKKKRKKSKKESSSEMSLNETPPTQSETVKKAPSSSEESSTPQPKRQSSTVLMQTDEAKKQLPELFALGPRSIEEKEGKKSYDIIAIKKTLLEQQQQMSQQQPVKKSTSEGIRKTARPFGRLPESLLVESSDDSPVKPIRKRVAYEPRIAFVKGAYLEEVNKGSKDSDSIGATSKPNADPKSNTRGPQPGGKVQSVLPVPQHASHTSGQNFSNLPHPQPQQSVLKSVRSIPQNVLHPAVKMRPEIEKTFSPPPHSLPQQSGKVATVSPFQDVSHLTAILEPEKKTQAVPKKLDTKREKNIVQIPLATREHYSSKATTEQTRATSTIKKDYSQTRTESKYVEVSHKTQSSAPTENSSNNPIEEHSGETVEPIDKEEAKPNNSASSNAKDSFLEDLYLNFSEQHKIKNSILMRRIEECKKKDYNREVHINLVRSQLGR
jgi:hypothetical protein